MSFLSRAVHSLPVAHTLLAAASLLVPRKSRAEWLQEWRAELWHVQAACNWNQEITAFCLGAFPDAFWLRRNNPAPRPACPPGAPSRCLLTLTAIAAAAFLLAFLLPGVRSILHPVPYPAADNLLLIARTGQSDAPFPTVAYAEYHAWTRNSGRLFRDLAYYQLSEQRIRTAPHASVSLPIIHATANLFPLLGLPVSTTQPGGGHAPQLVLSRSTWRRYFASDTAMLGRTVKVGGQYVTITDIIADEAWRLPGHAAAWLIEDSDTASSLPADNESKSGYVLAAPAQPAVGNQLRARGMYVPRLDPDGRLNYEWFDCQSLADRLRAPVSTFWFGLLLACLALPATTSLPLGDYPVNRKRVPWTTRGRRWLFLCLKLALIVAIVYAGSLDLAYGNPALGLAAAQSVQLFLTFWSLLIAFRWALRDQRRRCPVCLRTLTHPARVGQFSQNFLAWNGTELVCLSGHGLLHVPDLPTSWFSSQRWLYLDTSWSSLFAPEPLTPARTHL